MGTGNIEQHQGSRYIVPVVFEGLLSGFTNSLKSCKMNNGRNIVVVKYLLECFAVENGSLHERTRFFSSACQLTNTINCNAA